MAGGGFVAGGGLVAGGLVTGAFVGGGAVAGAAVVTVSVVGVAVVDTARVVVVEPTGGFGGTSFVEVFEDSTANAMPTMNKPTTIGTAILVQSGQRWSRDRSRSGAPTGTAGRIAVGSSAETTGTGSVG